MKGIQASVSIGLLMVLGTAGAQSQEPTTPVGGTSTAFMAPAAAVPRLVRFTGVLKDSFGKPLHGTVSVSFALYESQEDAVPLWQETQELQADMQGRYSVLLGATQSGGLPLDAFAGEQARWLGVQATGQAERPRVLLVSVPYALRAQEAEQLGGKSSSDYVLASDLLDTLSRQLQSEAQPSIAGKPPAGGQVGPRAGPESRSVADPLSKSLCLVWNGTKWALGGCTSSASTSGWPPSWVTNRTTNAVLARPLAYPNAVALTVGPSAAYPSADLFDVFRDSALRKKAFSVNADGFVTFGGNSLTLGQASQGTQSHLRLFGSTANSKLAPPYLELEKTDASVKTFLAASTTRNGAICVSGTAPTGDCPTSGTLVKRTAFVLPGGPSWTSGAGVPTGACTTGSLHSRTDGRRGSTLYVCEAGSWKAR